MARFLGIGNGSYGTLDLSTFTQTMASCSGSSGSTSLSATGSFSAGNRVFIIQMSGTNAGSYEDNKIASYSTGTITLVSPLENTYSNTGSNAAQVVVVPETSGITGYNVITPWNESTGGIMVLACSGVFSGVINGVGRGYYGATAQPGSGDFQGKQGGGSAGPRDTASNLRNGSGGGGGGEYTGPAGAAGAGSGGGNTTGATTGAAANSGEVAEAGAAVGDATLSTIFMGGGGGGGGSRALGAEHLSGAGGGGGGIVVVYTNVFSSVGEINVGGNVGGNPTRDGLGAGGGGAGGSILIKSVTFNPGFNLLNSFGGEGGYGGNSLTERGGNGSSGRIRIETCSITSSLFSNPTASTGIGGFSYCGSGFVNLVF